MKKQLLCCVPETLVVRYGINEAGFAWIEEAKVILKPGSRLYLRREGAWRVAVLYRANQVIEHETEHRTWRRIPG